MPTQIAREYIQTFKNDGEVPREPQGLVLNGKIDEAAFQILRQGLIEEDQEVREKIISLLKKLNDQTTGIPGNWLKDPSIIETLATEGIIKNDSASDNAIRLLLNNCTQETLEKYNKNYVDFLNKSPSMYILLLIAKAKTMEAKPIVEELLKTEKWKDNTSAEIAAAALGNKKIEDEYIGFAKDATTGDELRNALGLLKYIGTRRSLQTAASFLRSPLVIGPLKVSLRLKAIEALFFNNYDKDFLNSGGIHTQEDYARVEQFAADTLDVHFEGPLPPFYRDRPLPIPLPGHPINIPD